MDESLGPTLMVEPGTGRTCIVAKAHVEEFLTRGYRLLTEGTTEAEPPAEEEVPPTEDAAPAPAVDVTPFVQPDRPSVKPRRRRRA